MVLACFQGQARSQASQAWQFVLVYCIPVEILCVCTRSALTTQISSEREYSIKREITQTELCWRYTVVAL